jgi:hypothetical protein
MTDPGFLDRQREAWSRPPVDDVGYIPATDLLAKPDGELRAIVEQMRATRYSGWRNHDGLWRDLMGLDDPAARTSSTSDAAPASKPWSLPSRGTGLT